MTVQNKKMQRDSYETKLNIDHRNESARRKRRGKNPSQNSSSERKRGQSARQRDGVRV